MKYIFILWCIFAMSCKSTEKGVKNNTQIYPTDFITLERGACFGTCAVYDLTLYANGEVHYKGKMFTERKGDYTGQIDEDTAHAFFKQLNNYTWETYPDKYPIDNVDLPQFTLTYNTHEIEKTIQGNSRANKTIIDLTKMLDKFIEQADLKEK